MCILLSIISILSDDFIIYKLVNNKQYMNK